jgi:hypothetical protein
MNTSQLDALQVGDKVTRMLAGTIPMQLKITQIDDLIHCGPWTFHRDTGCEVDLELGWDGITTTGSFITL